MKQLNIRLPEELKKKLQVGAIQEGLSLEKYSVLILQRGLKA